MSHTNLLPTFEQLPSDLKELANARVWFAYFGFKPDGRLDKAPKNPNTGLNAKSTDLTTAGTFNEAYDRAKRHGGGVGIALGIEKEGKVLIGYDLDSCRDPISGILEPWAAEIIDRIRSYTEVSPSETGIKIFAWKEQDGAERKGFVHKKDSALGEAKGKHPAAVEYYPHGRYFTVTGKAIAGRSELQTVPAAVITWLDRDFAPRFTGQAQQSKAQEKGGRGQPRKEPRSDSQDKGHNHKGVTVDGEKLRSALAAIAPVQLSYDEWLAVGMAVHSLYPNDEGMKIWNEWSQQDEERYESSVIERKWTSFGQRDSGGHDKITVASLFKMAQERGWKWTHGDQQQDLDADILKINEDHSFVMEGGRALVFRIDINPVTKIKSYVRSIPHDFKQKLANRRYRIGSHKNSREVSLGEEWLRSPFREQYLNGVVFDPANRYGAGYKNLWQGFAFEPTPGSWNLLYDHLFRMICDGNEEVFTYVMNWAARAVQFPAKQGEVAIVLRGPEGAGKGLFARALKALFGTHGMQVTNASHLVGKFNAHLQCCVFLFADEAFYAGDRSHRDVLYTLITEPTFTVEAKFRDAAESQNYLHIMMATNNDWAVPAGLNDRRFLVLDVRDHMVGDTQYFAEIMNQLENQGGYEAMLHELLNRNITDFSHNRIPRTLAHDEQKIMSLDSLHKWWFHVLDRGYLWRSAHGLEDELHVWTPDISTDLAEESYLQYTKSRNDRYPKDREQIGRFLRTVGTKKQYRSKVLVMSESYSASENRYFPRRNKDRVRGYRVGSLDEARAAYCSLLKIENIWERDDPETEGGLF